MSCYSWSNGLSLEAVFFGISVELFALLRIYGFDTVEIHAGFFNRRFDLGGCSEHNRLSNILVLESAGGLNDSFVSTLRQNN